ncbi:MAG: ATP-binding protein [Acidobacteriota bacterium]
MNGKLFWIGVLGAIGFAANEFLTVPVYSGAAFRFGSIFVLLTAISLGPRAGVAAALLASWPFIADGEVHLAVLSVLEAITVGYLAHRRFMPLTADLIFWAFGSPLILGWTARAEGLFTAGSWVPALHAPVNGALCAVVADVLLSMWTTRIPGPQRLTTEHRQPLRWQLVHWLAFITLVPMLVVGLSVGRERAQEKVAESEAALRLNVGQVADQLQALIAENLRAVEAIGRELTLEPTDDSASLIARLEARRQTYRAVSTYLVADRDGLLIAGAPETRNGVKWWTDSVADRQYFQVPRQTGQSLVSDVFLGAGYSRTAIIGLSAPVFEADGRTVRQVVEGSVDVRELQRRVRPAVFAGKIDVVDRDLKSLFGLGESQKKPLDAFAHPDLASAISSQIAGDARLGPKEEVVIWRPVPVAGWTVVGQMPSRSADLAAARVYVSYASGMLLAVLLTSVFATAIALRLTGPLERLAASLSRVDAGTRLEVPDAGSTAPKEVADLVDSFDDMAGRLDESYRELRESLDARENLNAELEGLLGDLDKRVRERTAELATSRRRALEMQRLYRGLLDDIEAIVCEYDLHRKRFTFVSQRSGDILGYPPEAWYENRVFWLRLLPKEERLSIVGEMRRVTREGGKYAFEHPVTTASGRRIYLRNVGRVLTSDDGTRLLRCVMLDVTVAKQVQEDQVRRRQLEAVGTLAGGIAHDFNNLLTTVLGNLSLARMEVEEGGDPSELLDQIDLAGQDARRLSHQLLTFARGGQPILKACNLTRRLRELARVQHPVQVAVDVPDGLPRVLADRQQLRQVIHELLRNAEQAMPGGGVVEITAHQEDIAEGNELPLSPGPFVAFTVRDTGEGVPADLMSRVFDPYFTTKEEGRGFGLAATYSIVKSHGGHISFHSVRDQGTAVTVWLPAAVDVPEEPAPEPQPKEPAAAGRLLLMDDESSVRLVASRMLGRLGWDVTATADGQEALDAYAAALRSGKRFDMVFTDLTVPGGMGGAETMSRLLELDPKVRAVVCSGYSNDPVMAQYRDHGFVGVMTKPFTLQDLRRILDQAVREPLSERAATPPVNA